jgi:hypothetical protein
VINLSLDTFLQELANGLSIPHAAQDALTFVRLSGVEGLLGQPNAYSDVAPGPLPLELSFVQAGAAELRLLTESCVPGESILARTILGIAAVHDVIAAFFSPELAQRAQDLVRSLLPDAEEIPGLNWHSSVWLALRTNGGQPTVRIYVNAQFRDAEDRWLRLGRALSACGLKESKNALKRLRAVAAGLVEPIGLCFDVGRCGLVPARVHCVTSKISPSWLLQLLAATDNEVAVEDAADFLDLFGLLEYQGECPILVSLGLGTSDVGSLKIDVDVPSLRTGAAGRADSYLADAEARFGEIDTYDSVGWAINNAQPRYIGLTITPAVRYLNVYFPCSFPPPEDRPQTEDAATDSARVFVHAQLESTGALHMDARSSGTARAVPPKWADLYMTCLLLQVHSPALRLGAGVLERARSFVLATREDWFCRYLPDLPGDLDDTAMAWIALGPAGGGLDNAVEQVMANANPDGGFRTFIGGPGQNQPSHPAVTLNLTLALDQAGINWPRAASDQYLHRWLEQPDFPACRWMGSRLFPIFLFARATCLLERLGAAARERLVTTLIEMQRADGSWGSSLPDGFDTALAVITLDMLGADVPDGDMLKSLLLSFQLDDGGWGWSPLYSDGSGTWFGHRAITTAFAVRALEVLRSARPPWKEI